MATLADRITAVFMIALLGATALSVSGADVGLPGLPGGGDALPKGGERTGLIEGESLTNAVLHDCTVRDSTLELVQVTNCTVERSTLKRSTVTESTLRDSTVYKTGVTLSRVVGGEAELSSLEDSHVEGTRVVSSVIRVTDHGGDWAVVDAEVRKSNVENATMRGGVLAEATAINTRLEGVSVESAEVKHADLQPRDARHEGDRLVVTVANTGKAATYHFWVVAYGPGGEELGRSLVEKAPAGGTVDASVDTGGAAPGTVTVEVDAGDRVPEESEGNNRGSY